MEYLIGLDIGTTHLKGGAFTITGEPVVVKLTGTPVLDLGEGRAVYDPDVLWESVSGLLRQVTNELPPGAKVLAIAVASMGEAGLLLDAKGEPLTPIIAWHDSRGREMVNDWIHSFGAERVFSISGLSPDYIYSLMKLLWLKRWEPELLVKAHKWLCMMDYIIYRLTGEFATDYSIASRTMLFDIHRRDWSPEVAEFAELDINLFPTAYQGGTVVGEVTGMASSSTGLAKGVPVCTGGHDHICGAFATGVFEPGRALDSLGTAESLVMAYSEIPELNLETAKGFGLGCHVVGNSYYLLGGINSSGLSIEWFKNEFGVKEQWLAKDRGVSIYDVLVEAARESPVGARDLMFIPHMRGAGPPSPDPHSRASFLGIGDYHQRKDCLRAVLEGLALEFAFVLRGSEELLGFTVPKLHAIGGGTKNRLLMEIKAAVLDKPIEVPLVQESTLLGAALLGGLGVGVYDDEHDALSQTYRVLCLYEPVPHLVHKYAVLYEKYCQVMPLARQISWLVGRNQS